MNAKELKVVSLNEQNIAAVDETISRASAQTLQHLVWMSNCEDHRKAMSILKNSPEGWKAVASLMRVGVYASLERTGRLKDVLE